MRKQELFDALRKGLCGLPEQDIEERVSFYDEMINDRMEEGISEEQAVSEIGNVDEIISQIIADTPLTKLVKEKVKPKGKLRAWEIVLLALGFPIWFSLLIGGVAILLSLYISTLAIVISLWSVFISFGACGLAGVVAGTLYIVMGKGLLGAFIIGAGFILIGLAIFLFFGCKAATKGTVRLSKTVILGIKRIFMKKESI